jgi:hypothetical protein
VTTASVSPQAARQLEQPGIDRSNADHRRDRDGKNTISAQITSLAVSPGPNQIASSGESARMGVAWRSHQVGRQQSLCQRQARERVADEQGQTRADTEPERNLVQRPHGSAAASCRRSRP